MEETEDPIDTDQLTINHKVCNLDHPVFSLMGTKTRRDLLRLISCEHNYGNQLAKLLKVSNPTVHRHLKKMMDEEFISEEKRTVESYSGYRGGEAVVYNINSGTNVFLSILPHLVHAQVIEIDSKGSVISPEGSKIVPYKPNHGSTNPKISEYTQYEEKSQKLTREILQLEKQLIEKLHWKNNVMEKLDNLLQNSELNFNQRIILRAIACLGPGCFDDIKSILDVDAVLVEHYLSNLADMGWLTERNREGYQNF